MDFREAVGCKACGHTGYRGRKQIGEMLAMTPEIGQALRAGASVEEMQKLAVERGMTTMGADGVRRAAAGETSLEEVFRILSVRW